MSNGSSMITANKFEAYMVMSLYILPCITFYLILNKYCNDIKNKNKMIFLLLFEVMLFYLTIDFGNQVINSIYYYNKTITIILNSKFSSFFEFIIDYTIFSIASLIVLVMLMDVNVMRKYFYLSISYAISFFWVELFYYFIHN
jgi:hypothetical protein